MTPEQRSEIIRKLASAAGFPLCGLAPCEPLAGEEPLYRKWLETEDWGRMTYLRSQYAKRIDPKLLMPSARTVIAVLSPYFSGDDIPEEDNYLIARYARGSDYHVRVRKQLNTFADTLKETFSGSDCKAFLDSGVVMEKAWAQRCGLGWRGKNTVLIHPKHGSWFFIGILLTDLDAAFDPAEQDHCGSCTRCLEGCPSGALEQPHVLNPSKCISYWTLETDDPIPGTLAGRFRGRIDGCDICQEVCPFNRHPMLSEDQACRPSPALLKMRKQDWEQMTPGQFRSLFEGTAVIRTGYERLLRNIRFASQG